MTGKPQQTAIQCPKCRSTDVKVVSSAFAQPAQMLADGQRFQFFSKHKCQCGHRCATGLGRASEDRTRWTQPPIVPIVMELHAQGLSLRAIAGELERRGVKPRYGCRPAWSAAQVRRVDHRN
jgi:hypothetical protein